MPHTSPPNTPLYALCLMPQIVSLLVYGDGGGEILL
jgi:hypothetical protein